MKLGRSIAMLAACVTMAAPQGMAQRSGSGQQAQSPADILRSANARSAEMEQLRQNLRSPDQSVRLATFEAMVDSNSPSMREMAISEGFAGTDEAMKSMSFRAALIGVSAIHIEPKGLPPGQAYLNWDTFQRLFDFRIKEDEYDWRTGSFCERNSEGVCRSVSDVAGQMSGRTFSYKNGLGSPRCAGQLVNVDGTWEFEGRISCTANGGATLNGDFKMKIR